MTYCKALLLEVCKNTNFGIRLLQQENLSLFSMLQDFPVLVHCLRELLGVSVLALLLSFVHFFYFNAAVPKPLRDVELSSKLKGGRSDHRSDFAVTDAGDKSQLTASAGSFCAL